MHGVKEFHGLYGPFTVSERVLHQIWRRQEFKTDALKLVSGKSLKILSFGEWNHLGGPDFKGAELEIDGVLQNGDVEIHFEVPDWWRHGHDCNEAFDGVVLHVVLNAPKNLNACARVNQSKGKALETLVLMPLLHWDLEVYNEEYALFAQSGLDGPLWIKEFLNGSRKERIVLLDSIARKRWEAKLEFAKKRLSRHGWEESCHQFALEVLGYSRNRAAMSTVALKWPFETWCAGLVSPEELYADTLGWARGGVRPANHPLSRLKQYQALVRYTANWPKALRLELSNFCELKDGMQTTQFRKESGLTEQWKRLRTTVFGDRIGETRLNTLMIDGFLPLGSAEGLVHGFEYWWHWPLGDCSMKIRNFLKAAGLHSKEEPFCNGRVQGALGLFMTDGKGL